MARQFTTAKAAFHDLLDRYEAVPRASRLDARVDHDGFRSVTDYDRLAEEAMAAEKAGAITCRYGKDARRGQIIAIRLSNPDALYRWLGRVPTSDQSAAAMAMVEASIDLPPALAATLPEIANAWSRNKSWAKIEPLATDALMAALKLAKAILEERHHDLDYRTFSSRYAGQSKALERLKGAVVRLLGSAIDRPPGISPREVLAGIGLEKWSQPLLVSGPVLTASLVSSSRQLPYVGLPPECAGDLLLTRHPKYFLSIENFASFQRHASELNQDGSGLVVYTGGFPSRAIQRALAILTGRLDPATPFWHWSDIDEGGVGIFRAVERIIGRPLRPHLMSADIARQVGTPPKDQTSLKLGAAAGSAIAELNDYLAGPEARTLEQEEIDPEIPSY